MDWPNATGQAPTAKRAVGPSATTALPARCNPYFAGAPSKRALCAWLRISLSSIYFAAEPAPGFCNPADFAYCSIATINALMSAINC